MRCFRMGLVGLALALGFTVQAALQPQALGKAADEKPDPERDFFRVPLQKPTPAQSKFDEVCQVSASVEPTAAKPGEKVVFKLAMKLKDGWHTYPTKQLDRRAKPFENAVALAEAAGLQPDGEWRDQPNALTKSLPEQKINALRYYEKEVVYEQTLVVPKGVGAGDKKLTARITPQVCSDNCLPPPTLERSATLKVIPGSFDDAAQFTARFEPAEASPGDTVTLKMTLNLAPGWQTFPTEQLDPKASEYVNRVRLMEIGPLQPLGSVASPPTKLFRAERDIQAILYYEKAVTWEQRFKIPEDAKTDTYNVSALFLAKVCEQECFSQAVRVEAGLRVAPKNQVIYVAPQGTFTGKYAEAVKGLRVVVEPATLKRGQTVQFKLEVQIASGWHTYPITQTLPKHRTSDALSLMLADASGSRPGPLAEGLVPVGQWKDLGTVDEGGSKAGRLIMRGPAGYERPFVVHPAAKPGKTKLHGVFNFQVCTDETATTSSICLPQRRVPFEAELTILEEKVDVDPQFAAQLGSGGDQGDGDTLDATGPGADTSDFWAFILQGVIFGLISLVTPCVFPMIPITVSFFLKQSEKEGHRPIVMASIYSGTIVIVLTIGAALLLTLFQQAIQHWATNIILGAVFVYFALSLFGMYEIRLPSFLARYTSAHEAKGGVTGTIFMALTFTIISFSCVAPFLGGFAGLSANASTGFDWIKIVLGALAFAVTFAAPFFLLALFPPLLRLMPKSGSWMNTVKVVMGFLEIAAALKFLRAGELLVSGEAQFLTFDFVLGLYVAICVACGLYLLGLFRLPHDDPEPSIGVPRFMFSLTFLGLALYLTPALFARSEEQKQRPNGVVFSWLESFLLPDGEGGIGDIFAAMDKARTEKKRLFLNFTGET